MRIDLTAMPSGLYCVILISIDPVTTIVIDRFLSYIIKPVSSSFGSGSIISGNEYGSVGRTEITDCGANGEQIRVLWDRSTDTIC